MLKKNSKQTANKLFLKWDEKGYDTFPKSIIYNFENTDKESTLFSITTGNSQLATGNSQLATRNWQLATRNSQLATRNSQLATRNSQLATRQSCEFFISCIAEGQLARFVHLRWLEVKHTTLSYPNVRSKYN